MTPQPFTDRQAAHGRLAEALRELQPHVTDVILGEANGHPIVWPADNIRQVLGDAADLIVELILRAGERP